MLNFQNRCTYETTNTRLFRLIETEIPVEFCSLPPRESKITTLFQFAAIASNEAMNESVSCFEGQVSGKVKQSSYSNGTSIYMPGFENCKALSDLFLTPDTTLMFPNARPSMVPDIFPSSTLERGQ